jgi:hypothetical protein
VTPGVELLTAIGAELKAFRMTGDVLADQGAMVTGMLASGWTPGQICDVVAGQPLPVPITTSVGAVISWRLRQAARGPVPASVARIPEHGGDGREGFGFDHQEHYGRDDGNGADGPTPAPESWVGKRARIEAALSGAGLVRNCAEDDNPDGPGCTQLAVRGGDRCPEHLGWPLCTACGKRRVRPAEAACERCADDLGPVSDAELAGLLAEAARCAQEQEDQQEWDRGYRESQTDTQPHDAPF